MQSPSDRVYKKYVDTHYCHGLSGVHAQSVNCQIYQPGQYIRLHKPDRLRVIPAEIQKGHYYSQPPESRGQLLHMFYSDF